MKLNLLSFSRHCVLIILLLIATKSYPQSQYELTGNWKCKPAAEVKASGLTISHGEYDISSWTVATVPGTILTTLLNNHQIPDPFYGMNNKLIPDIYNTGPAHYTYWFVTDFTEKKPEPGGQVYLNLRGVNYGCTIYCNGHQLNNGIHYGMFLRQSYNITPFLSTTGKNRLAVIVYPAPVPGNPNGGQGGDGTIARNISLQYTAGWDWIQPIHDRNTGIWDKVTIQKTGSVKINDPHIITLVPGTRQVQGKQQPALINASAQLFNPTNKPVKGVLVFIMGGEKVSQNVLIKSNTTLDVRLKTLTLNNPKLWWPNGYGEQYLYKSSFQFFPAGNKLSDQVRVNVGVRQIETNWNNETKSRQIAVNGQKIFVKGGNWIVSDAMLRFSEKRYDAEIRFHRDMNLNLIRVWGGALVERPEFYDACDRYGMLVFQDFWISGDANGRWLDPMKKDDQWTRRNYPDDHKLYLESLIDQIKLVRNHASLAIWCGGNEITPPEDILLPVRDSILPKLDGTRWFVEYSNSDKMSLNTLGGNGDGPYNVLPDSAFWKIHTYPFNSEIGSVGLSDYESLKRFIPKENLVAPEFQGTKRRQSIDSVWDYHKYIGYDASIEPYGKATDARDFSAKAQLVNYNQYRALIEGFSNHMWDWYTGVIIWKTQNPWTAMRGQMYDYYLDPNACLYGLHSGSEPLHVMYNPLNGMVTIVNNTFDTRRDLMLVVKTYDMQGKAQLLTQVFEEILPSSVKGFVPIKNQLDKVAKEDGVFLSLQLLDLHKNILSDNFYWLPNEHGEYSGLQKMDSSQVSVVAKQISAGKIEVTLTNQAHAPVAFFNRLSLVDPQTYSRLLPVFYSDNYVSVLPGAEKTIIVDYDPVQYKEMPMVNISGWNLKEQNFNINK
ncbi:MAG: glycoside hydrolase family 2 protein [Mucilaginibacter sp.]